MSEERDIPKIVIPLSRFEGENRLLRQENTMLKQQLAALQAENARLKEALVIFGGHIPRCAVFDRTAISPQCTCGFQQALEGGGK